MKCPNCAQMWYLDDDKDRCHRILPEREKLLEYGVDADRLVNIKFRSPAQLEKELNPDEWEVIEDIVFKPTGRMVLAREDDPRKAVSPNDDAKRDWSEEGF